MEMDEGIIKYSCTNLTASPISLVWDEGAFVDTYGFSERLINGDTKLSHMDLAQPPTVVYPKYPFLGVAMPYSGRMSVVYWQESHKGRSFHLLLPVLSNNITYNYDFEFIVSSVEKVSTRIFNSTATAYLITTLVCVPIAVVSIATGYK
jgi:hypothetical protein